MLLSLALAAMAMTDPPNAGVSAPHAHTNPDWLRKPTLNDLIPVWPTAELSRGRGGRVLLTCQVTVSGFAEGCVVKSETPEGVGFGAAALSVTRQMLFKPATDDGTPVPSKVTVPVVFPARAHAGNEVSVSVNTLANPVWTSTPSAMDLVHAYPPKGHGVGFVAFRCETERDGRVSNCDVLQEAPAGMGFARAGRSLLSLYRLDPAQTQSRWTTLVTVRIRLAPPAP
jgi:TonB family protein